MESIYIIIENGEPYPNAYHNYKSAVDAVKIKHKKYIEEQIKEIEDLYSIETILGDINVSENTENGKTLLYIEKGIHIYIHKINIP